MIVRLKHIVWLGDSLEIVRGWPESTRKSAGEELFRLQLGSEPLHWRSMKSVGRGVREVKISVGRQFRVFYVIRGKEKVFVLHAFEKKTGRTSKVDIEMARQRLRAI